MSSPEGALTSDWERPESLQHRVATAAGKAANKTRSEGAGKIGRTTGKAAGKGQAKTSRDVEKSHTDSR